MPSLVIEMGHCYRTTGATGTTGEQSYATKVADKAIQLLNGKNGWTVRKKLADDNFYSGNAFVAIHCDGSLSSSARGASVGYRNAEGQQFAHATMLAYARRGWTGGFRPDNYTTALAQYYGTGKAIAAGNRRAFIMECGFRTNAGDLALLDGPGGVDRVVLSIGEALGIGVDMADFNDPQFQALAWRTKAILDLRETLEGGPPGVIGSSNQLAIKLNKFMADTSSRLTAIENSITNGFTLTPTGSITVTVDPTS